MSKTRSIWLIAFLVFGLSASAVVLVVRPYSLDVILEGFPAATWPAEGHFAVVPGQSSPRPLPLSHVPMNDWAAELFEQSQGTALLALHNGQIKLEAYVSGSDADTQFNSYSMVKSLIGALVLRAHGEGRIRDLHDPLGRYLPEFADAPVRAIPISGFLTMRSGLDFEISSKILTTGSDPKEKQSAHYSPFGPMAKLHMQGLSAVEADLGLEYDGVRKSVSESDAEIGAEPFRYQNINTAILAHLLTQVYQRPIEALLSEKIWVPAGAGDAHWRRYGRGKPVSAYCCLYATARDWARVGSYLMNNGSKETPFLPRALWARFFGVSLGRDERNGDVYGDHVRHNILNRAGEPLQGAFTYFLGNGGQTTYLMPQAGLVVVRFGRALPLLHSTLYSIWRSMLKCEKADPLCSTSLAVQPVKTESKNAPSE